ncbi:hypothetical protein AAG906_003556 [Vitis piasezkii]
MERLTVMKSFNRPLPPSPYCSYLPKTAPLRDASFSAYLNPDGLTSAPKKDVPAIAEDSEISIFDAQKYFNESSEHQQRESKRVAPVGAEHCESQFVTRTSSVSSVEGYGRNYRARSFHATPTASSEASWNSQTGLLCNPPGTIGVSVRSIGSEKKNVSGRKWFFGRKCPCSGKKAVEIQEKVSEPRSPIRLNHNLGSDPKRPTERSSGNTLQKVSKKSAKSLDSPHGHGRDWADRHDLTPSPPKFPPATHFPSNQLARRVLASGTGFSFPILSQAPPVKLVFTSARNPIPLEDPPRDSLEIFRPSDDCISRKSTDSIPPGSSSFTFSASPKSRGTAMDDDVASDASSDLFEIESFTTQTTTTTATNYPMYHRRDSLDDASRRFGYCRQSLDEPATPSVAPTECYEPSEASIDWSVTTAEGFDRGSVTNFSVSASDIVDDVTLMRQELQRLGNGGFNDNDGKAVSVGPGPTPVKEGQWGRGGGPGYIGSSTSRHVSSRVGVVNKPPLARSHSARLSLTFAT